LKRAGVPTKHRTARTKPEIALAEIDRMIAAGVRFGCVLADAGYGMSAPFRHASRSAACSGPLVFLATSRCTLSMCG
jgi:SRSO17 transposase